MPGLDPRPTQARSSSSPNTVQRRGPRRYPRQGAERAAPLINDVDAGRFPGLILVATGPPAFFDGPQGAQRLPPLAQRLHADFFTDPDYDNPRAVQIRLPGVHPRAAGRARWQGPVALCGGTFAPGTARRGCRQPLPG